MFGMVIERVLVPEMAKISGDRDKKIVAVGIAKILCDCPTLLGNPYRNYWTAILQALIQIFELPPDENLLDGDSVDMMPGGAKDDDNSGYQAAYSQLLFAQTTQPDPLPDIQNGHRFLVDSLAKLSQIRSGGEIKGLIAQMPADHQQALQKYCTEAGVQIV